MLCLQDALDTGDKRSTHRFNVDGRFGRGLQENETVLLSELFALLRTYSTPLLLVAFITYEHDGHARVSVLFRFLEPSGQVQEAVSSGDVVH